MQVTLIQYLSVNELIQGSRNLPFPGFERLVPLLGIVPCCSCAATPSPLGAIIRDACHLPDTTALGGLIAGPTP